MEATGYYRDEIEQNHQKLSKANRILSITGGALLVTSALGNLFPPKLKGIINLAGGAYLLYRGSKGYCPLTEALSINGKVLNIRESLHINRPKEEVYELWRSLEILPQFMKHLDTVIQKTDRISAWSAKIPGGLGTIDWDAEILIDKRGEEISWRSVANSLIDNSGKVVFRTGKDGISTEVLATITYNPPAGSLGKGIAKIFNNKFESMIREDLKGFKLFAESTSSQTVNLPGTKSSFTSN